MTNDDAEVIGRRGSYAKGVARRLEILDRAIEVFADRGADGTSLRRIAESIGVSHAALLHYFDSREQLLVAVYEHAERRHRELHPRSDGVAAVHTMVEAAARNVTVPGLVQLYSMLVATAVETENVSTRGFVTERFERVRADITRRLIDEQAAGTVRGDVEAATLATMLIAISDGVQTQWLLQPEIDLRGTIQAFDTLLRPAA